MQTFADEIILPRTKPETEWIDGRAVAKVMPTREHGIVQAAFAEALRAWARPQKRGDVATEWRFRVSSFAGQAVHPLVPDVAFMSFERLRSLPSDDRTHPLIASEIVVEILSPDDKPKNVETKRKEYLAWGVSLVLIVTTKRAAPKPTTARAGTSRSALSRLAYAVSRVAAEDARIVRRARHSRRVSAHFGKRRLLNFGGPLRRTDCPALRSRLGRVPCCKRASWISSSSRSRTRMMAAPSTYTSGKR